MNSIKSRLLLGVFLISLLVAFITAFTVQEQLNTADAAARIEAANLATALAYSSSDKVVDTDKTPLQNYVYGLHLIYNRDITVVDLNKLRIADADAPDVGNRYQYDKDNEVAQTLKDGRFRHFTEVSPQFPSGTKQIVVPIRKEHAKGESAIVGAVMKATRGQADASRVRELVLERCS